MRRRALLSSLAVGVASLAGCAANSGTETKTATHTSTETETPGEEHTSEPPDLGTLGSVAVAESTPRTYALSPTRYRSDDGGAVEIAFSATATDDHPARLRATLRNANAFANTFVLGQTPPLGPDTNILGPTGPDPSHRQTLVLAPTENHELADTAPNIRQDAQGYWRLVGDPADWGPETVRLSPGETVHFEYALVGRRGGQGRPPGTYVTRADERRVRITVWNTEKPGPRQTSRFENAAVPSVSPDSETQWFHAADETTPTFLRPATERADLPTGVEFTFVNHTDQALGCGGWNLYKLHDGKWFHIAPQYHLAVCRRLAPGGTESLTLRAYTGEAVPCDDGLAVGHLGGGRYAVSVDYGHRTGLSAAMVALRGPPVEVTPTTDVTSSRDGATVTATSSRWNDGTSPPNARLVVVRTDENPVDQLIPEQVMRRGNRGLRNTLPFFEEGVTEVVLRTDERAAKTAFEKGEPRTFEYRGAVYEATIET